MHVSQAVRDNANPTSSRQAARQPQRKPTQEQAQRVPLWARLRGAATPLQAKLTVNQPGDPYEQEADRVAEQVTASRSGAEGMRKPEPAVQRCGPGCGCAACAARQAQEELVQTKRAGSAGGGGEAPTIVHHVLRSPGRPLEAGVRAFMEPRFGRDFSGVRVHTDAQAAQSAQAVDARAYTVGQHVVFGSGQYAPHSAAGRQLLAHELTHVVQQRQPGRSAALSAVPPRLQRAPAPAAVPSASQPALCTGKTLDEARRDVESSALIASVLTNSDSFMPQLYLDLKRARTCFPQFDEAAFLALVPPDPLYSAAMRKRVAQGYPAAVAKDDRKLVWRESQKPFAGYEVAGFDPSSRFTTSGRLRQFGYSPTPSHTGAKETAADPSRAQKSFAEADILVFSGHQYAQYKVPGLWADDSGQVAYDIRTLSGPLNNVKLIVSTSCATICRDPAIIWKSLFPQAVFLGYKKSAPLNGAVMAASFASKLPKDLLLEAGGGGVQSAVQAWKDAIQINHAKDTATQAGWMDIAANQVEYWTGKEFVTVTADSEQNACKEKGDYSADNPDPGTWRQPSTGSIP